MTEPLAAADTCEHHYETRILGGHPITVRACTLCHKPDWADLGEQAIELYWWGWQEGCDGKQPRATLSACDKPPACIHPEGYEGECPCPPSCACCRVEAASLLREQLVAAIADYPVACWTPGNLADRALAVVLTRGKFLGDQLRDSEARLAETRTALQEALDALVHNGGVPPAEADVDRWRAVLDPPEATP